MDGILKLPKKFADKLLDTIDGKIGVFSFYEGNNYISDRFFDILGTDNSKKREYADNPGSLIAFLEDNCLEVNDEDGCSFLFGMIDDEEKYITINLFKADGGTFGFVIDKTVQVHKQEKAHEEIKAVRKTSHTDALTGILNRNGFEATVNPLLLKNSQIGALCIFDMDNFKSINDTLGHPVGDEALICFAELLKKHFPDNAVIGRIGGDEFVVFVTCDITHESISKRLTDFANEVKDFYGIKFPGMNIASSMGAVLCDSTRAEYAELYKAADSALYVVKENGKAGFKIV